MLSGGLLNFFDSKRGKELSPLNRPCELFAARSVFVVACFVLCDVTKAAPLVFQFDATISQVQGAAVPLDVPFSLTVGQRIDAQYTFSESQDLLDLFSNPSLAKQGQIALTIDGVQFGALTNIGFLNSGVPVDINVPLPPMGPTSSVSLGYVSHTDVFPGWGGSIGMHPCGAGLSLVGAEGTIVGPEDVLDFDKLNQLTTIRGLGLQFGYFQSGEFKIVTVAATVGDIVAVPEPSNEWLVFVSPALGMAFFSRQIRQVRSAVVRN